MYNAKVLVVVQKALESTLKLTAVWLNRNQTYSRYNEIDLMWMISKEKKGIERDSRASIVYGNI